LTEKVMYTMQVGIFAFMKLYCLLNVNTKYAFLLKKEVRGNLRV